MNLQSENVPHFLCLLWLKQFQIFWKFKRPNSFFFKNPVQKKFRFLKIFRQKQLWINCEQRQKTRRCYSTSYACYQKKTIFKGAWESPNLRSRNNRKKVAISGNFRSGRLPNIVLSSVSVTKLILGNTISYVMNGNFFAQYVLLGACKTGIG